MKFFKVSEKPPDKIGDYLVFVANLDTWDRAYFNGRSFEPYRKNSKRDIITFWGYLPENPN